MKKCACCGMNVNLSNAKIVLTTTFCSWECAARKLHETADSIENVNIEKSRKPFIREIQRLQKCIAETRHIMSKKGNTNSDKYNSLREAVGYMEHAHVCMMRSKHE